MKINKNNFNRIINNLNFTSNHKGITLVALILTIILMLILVSVTVTASIKGGIFTSTEKAREQTEKSQYQKALHMLGSQSRIEVGTNENEKYLDRYEVNIKKEELFNEAKITRKDKDTIIVETKEGYVYEITEKGVKQVIDTDTDTEKPTEPSVPSKAGELAKNVLKTNPNAEKPEEKSPYVKYNNRLWRVLYDDASGNGVQLISNESVGDIELGYNDTQADANEFTYAGEDTSEKSMNFKKAAASYNNVVDRLNKEAEKYITKDASDIAAKARCLGSAPDFSGDINKTTEFGSQYYYFNIFDKKFKEADNLYETDLNTVISLKMNLSKEYTWLASRIMESNRSETYIGIVTIIPDEIVGDDEYYRTAFTVVTVDVNRVMSAYSGSAAFRPVILLKSGVKIIGNGDGSKYFPYELSV